MRIVVPHDYLYVDGARLQSYYEQIRPKPAYDKIPEWKTDIGLTGPKAGVTQKVNVRDATTHEKITALVDYLKERKFISNSFDFLDVYRNGSKGRKGAYVPFVFNRLRVTRSVLPLKSDPTFENNGKALWLHSNRDEITDLSNFGDLVNVWIMEDYTGSDSPVYSPRVSFYSAFLGMILDRYQEFSETVLEETDFFDSLNRNRLEFFENSQNKLVDRLMFENPAEVVQDLGGRIVSPSRCVEVLCRIREYWGSATMGTHVFCYAIFVRE